MNSIKTALVVAPQVPFASGGAEALVAQLVDELRARNISADLVTLPFSAIPKHAILNSMAAWRALDLETFGGRPIDLVIATKFPSYFVRHPNKVLWLVHQHRQMYELYDTRFGDIEHNSRDEALRRAVYRGDDASLRECRKRYAISANVSQRVDDLFRLDVRTLPPPPPLRTGYARYAAEPYLLSVGRLCSIKRVDMLIRAAPQITEELEIRVVGAADEPHIAEYLESEVEKHHLWHRVKFLGRVTNEELVQLYARAFSVVYVPFDEDYGFVTLEALASGKPVVTCEDSGGVLDFIENGVNGLVVPPDPIRIAEGCNRLWNDRELYDRLCASICETPDGLSPPIGHRARYFPHASWDEICHELTSP